MANVPQEIPKGKGMNDTMAHFAGHHALPQEARALTKDSNVPFFELIDPHVHCGNRIGELLELGRGLSRNIIIIDDTMVTSREAIIERTKFAKEEGGDSRYKCYIEVKEDKDQIEEAVGTAKELPQVVGLSMSTLPSAGPLSIPKESQIKVYEELARLNYDGVLAVHCERDDEISSIKEQIKLKRSTGFNGTLYIVHISTQRGADRVNLEGRYSNIRWGRTLHNILQLERRGQEEQPEHLTSSYIHLLKNVLLEGNWIESILEEDPGTIELLRKVGPELRDSIERQNENIKRMLPKIRE